jgi:nitroreductase
MERAGSSESEIKALLKADPGIQNIGAAAENFMLKAADMDYGTCWMTSQNYAALEIQSYLGIDKDKYYLALITPLGVPAEEVNSPKRKDLSEVVTWIK